MTDFVLGFRFRGAGFFGAAEVALIEKKRPHWQAGRLNGIGGRIEVSDFHDAHVVNAAAHAMVREFREETGIATGMGDWRRFGELQHAGNRVFLFASHAPYKEELLQATDERVMWVPTGLLHMAPIMPNLLWMIPMALDKDRVVATIVDSTPIPVKPAEVPA